MATIDSTRKRVDDPGLPNSNRLRRERNSSLASAVPQTTERGSLLWTILLAGLVISLVDLFYIANYLERTPTVEINAPIRDPSEFLSTVDSPKDDPPQPHPESSPDTEHATTERSVEKPIDDSKNQDKGPILNLLTEAGIDLDGLEQTVIDSLPLWSTVVKLYGDKPLIVGLDTCEAFRSKGDPAEHFLGVAGTFNTGTNLMAELFIANCHMPARMAKYGKVNRGIRWQVRY
jgi:hypothetical protein